MPSKSAKQHRFMEAIAHSPSFAKKVGVKQSVGKDFAAADKGKTFARGGSLRAEINKQNTRHGKMDLPVTNLNRLAGMKEGGNVKNSSKLFKGNESYGEEMKEAKAIKAGKISPKQYAMGEKSEEKKYAKGGGIEARGKTKGTVIRMASGGSVSSASRRADGIAQRGKTRC